MNAMKSVAKLLPLSEGSKLTSGFSSRPLCLTVDWQHSWPQDKRGKVVFLVLLFPTG